MAIGKRQNLLLDVIKNTWELNPTWIEHATFW
jgi:hypothetical protein